MKNANGKNAKHPTPRVADIYAPHVFHGISEEVIVALSSKALDKFLASKPCLLNASLYILPGITIAKYWSATAKLVPIAVNIVANISPKLPFANFNMNLANASSIPVFSNIPPVVKAQIISDTVDNILSSPPRVKSASTNSIPVEETYPSFATINTSANEAPWNTIATKAPNKTPIISPGIAGTFKITKAITKTGTKRSNGDNVL